MKYLILTQPNKAYAMAISKAIWNIRHPRDFQTDKDETSYYCGYVSHSDGSIALEFPDEIMKVHPSGSFGELIYLVSAPLPTNELKQIVKDHFDNLFPRKKDDPDLTVEHVLPSIYAANLKTTEQMEELGWFNYPEII